MLASLSMAMFLIAGKVRRALQTGQVSSLALHPWHMMWPLWHWYTSLPTLSLHTGHSRDSSTLFMIEMQRQLAGSLDKLLRRDWMKSSTLFCVLGFDDLAAIKRLGG